MIPRTDLQKRANALDLEMYRVTERMREFAADLKQDRRRAQIIVDAAVEVGSARGAVRQFMHEQDREATGG